LKTGSIKDNIAYGRPNCSLEEIIQAAKAANAHDFIVNFPDGYDSYVGERGQRLSGGERQRIAIARAILHNPKLLVLDEATSSVDTETERMIQEALERLVEGRTVIAIAHRLSTLRAADRLIVLQDGRIAEIGTHDELMAEEGGIYAKLVQMQTEMNRVKDNFLDEEDDDDGEETTYAGPHGD
jgi:ATP-binding cassette subfamily B protein